MKTRATWKQPDRIYQKMSNLEVPTARTIMCKNYNPNFHHCTKL